MMFDIIVRWNVFPLSKSSIEDIAIVAEHSAHPQFAAPTQKLGLNRNSPFFTLRIIIGTSSGSIPVRVG